MGYAAVFIVGIVGSRISMIGIRGGIVRLNIFTFFIGMLSTFVIYSLIVWGFTSLAWYWPVGTFLFAQIIATVTITKANWSAWFVISPILDFFAIASGLYLWIWHWPF